MNDDLFWVAALWEDPDDWTDNRPTYTMVTTKPNQAIIAAHDRMPVLLDSEAIDFWLSGEAPVDGLKALMVPCPDDWISIEDAGPVKTRVEKVDDKTPEAGPRLLID